MSSISDHCQWNTHVHFFPTVRSGFVCQLKGTQCLFGQLNVYFLHKSGSSSAATPPLCISFNGCHGATPRPFSWQTSVHLTAGWSCAGNPRNMSQLFRQTDESHSCWDSQWWVLVGKMLARKWCMISFCFVGLDNQSNEISVVKRHAEPQSAWFGFIQFINRLHNNSRYPKHTHASGLRPMFIGKVEKKNIKKIQIQQNKLSEQNKSVIFFIGVNKSLTPVPKQVLAVVLLGSDIELCNIQFNPKCSICLKMWKVVSTNCWIHVSHTKDFIWTVDPHLLSIGNITAGNGCDLGGCTTGSINIHLSQLQ